MPISTSTMPGKFVCHSALAATFALALGACVPGQIADGSNDDYKTDESKGKETSGSSQASNTTKPTGTQTPGQPTFYANGTATGGAGGATGSGAGGSWGAPAPAANNKVDAAPACAPTTPAPTTPTPTTPAPVADAGVPSTPSNPTPPPSDAGTGTVATPACATAAEISSKILTPKCGNCHGKSSPAAGLDLVTTGVKARLLNVASRGCAGKILITATPTVGGHFFAKLAGAVAGCGNQMPFGAPPLSAEEVKCLEDWISPTP